MKILQVVHGFPPENTAGTEVYTYNLSRELSKRHQVSVFYREADFSKNEYEVSRREVDGLKLFSINNTFRDYASFESTYKDARVAEKFGEVLDEIKPDIVHIQHLLYLSTGIVGESKKRGIPVIFTLNDYWLLCPQGQLFKNNQSLCSGRETTVCARCVLYQLGIRKNISYFYALLKKHAPEWLFQGIKSFYLFYARAVYLSNLGTEDLIRERRDHMRNVFSQVDLFIAPSDFLKKLFVAFGVPDEKIKILPYGFDLQRVRALPKRSSPVVRFGFIGNLMPAKGVHVLIGSFRALHAENAELKIYGNAFSYKSALGNYAGRLREAAKGYKNIRFMGKFDNQSVGEVFSEVDALVVPSLWYENSPLVIQEALLTRTPVIASRIGGIPELVKDGENGFLFEAGNERDLEETLRRIARDPGVLNGLNKNVLRVSSIKDNAKETESIYEDLSN